LEHCGIGCPSDATIVRLMSQRRRYKGMKIASSRPAFRRVWTICAGAASTTRVVLALGITWILDGLEVTLAGALSGALKESPRLQFTNFDVGFSNSAYLAGAVLGALGFGWLTDRIGRKKLFFITLALYLHRHGCTPRCRGIWPATRCSISYRCRIGGEYTRQFDDPGIGARALSRMELTWLINGSFWIGAALGAISAIVLLDPAVIGPDLGWRLAYLTGACLGLVVFVMRMWIPESPRWLMIHGQPDRAHAIVDEIERSAIGKVARPSSTCVAEDQAAMRHHTPLREVAQTLFSVYRQRSMVGLALMTAQAFFLQRDLLHLCAGLDRLLRDRVEQIGWYILPFSAGNFLVRCCSAGCSTRSDVRAMITFTYAVSGILLALSGYLFSIGMLSAQTQTIA